MTFTRRQLLNSTTAAILAGNSLSALAAHAEGESRNFGLADGDTVVFVGDSITQAGGYIHYIDAYLRTRFPEKTFRLINSGRGSETLAGMTEADHPGPRPLLFDRFDRDVADYDPNVVVACYGMNDGIYHPLGAERFDRFKRGVQGLIDRLHDRTRAKLILLTPPVCDTLNAGQPDERPDESYGYKQPFADYDQVLAKYAEWERNLHVNGVTVIDLHTRFKNHLLTRRKTDPNFRMQGDAIHPDATGHLLIAMTLLQAWNAPAFVDEAHIDSQGNKVLSGNVSRLSVDVSGTNFNWTTRLPMPADTNWDSESLALEKFAQTLNKQTLSVTRLRMPAYQIYINDVDCGRFLPNPLKAGLDMNALLNSPLMAQSRMVLPLIRQWHKLGYAPYHKTGHPPVEAERAALEMKLRDLCKPTTLAVRMIPTT